jgi:hypothetical protein
LPPAAAQSRRTAFLMAAQSRRTAFLMVAQSRRTASFIPQSPASSRQRPNSSQSAWQQHAQVV